MPARSPPVTRRSVSPNVSPRRASALGRMPTLKFAAQSLKSSSQFHPIWCASSMWRTTRPTSKPRWRWQAEITQRTVAVLRARWQRRLACPGLRRHSRHDRGRCGHGSLGEASGRLASRAPARLIWRQSVLRRQALYGACRAPRCDRTGGRGASTCGCPTPPNRAVARNANRRTRGWSRAP